MSEASAAAAPPADSPAAQIAALVARARTAQQELEHAGQEAADTAALAAAWALLHPPHNRRLAQMAVETTGLGNVEDKIAKNHRKTLGLLRDMHGVRTMGVVAEDAATGITEILRPVGVVGAVTPSTNPVATPTNMIVNALKAGNAIILAPSPKGLAVAGELLALVQAEFVRAKLQLKHAADLVQVLPQASRELTRAMMQQVDLLVVTGSQNNVRAGYASGTPCLGVGAGNVTAIVDETADVQAAAERIAASKIFDNATSCSSENSVILVQENAAAARDALTAAGGLLLGAADKARLQALLWDGGALSRDWIAQDAATLLQGLNTAREAAGETPLAAEGVKFLMVEENAIGADAPFSGEKMSPVLAVYEAADYAAAVDLAERLLNHQGRGHSVGLHSAEDARAVQLGLRLPACRVIVNQAHCFATGGAYDNAMPFSLSMGCGSWGGNSFADNFNFRLLSQRVRVVRRIPARPAVEEEIFDDYWRRIGKTN